MSTLRLMSEKAWLLLLMAIVLNCRPCFSQRIPEILNPKTYTSQSGQFSVRVDPGDIYGRDGASYQLRKDGVLIWSKQLPVTLQEAGVTDKGVIAGYGYSNGPEGFATDRKLKGPGNFHVVVINAKGEFLCNDATPRASSRFLHTLPNPAAHGIIFDDANDRLVVRIADADVNRMKESWQVYQISTGKAVNEFKPAKRIRNSRSARFVIDAKPINGTSLTLVHWWSYDDGSVGARFAAIDLNGKPVWTLDLYDDYEVPGNRKAEDGLREYIRKHGAIFQSSDNRQIQLLIARESQKVTFSVEPKANRGWTVKEVGRVPTKISLTIEPPVTRSIKEQRLESLGVIELKSLEAGPASLFEGVKRIELDGKDRISFVKDDEKGGHVFLVVDEDGKQLHSVPLDATDDPNERWSGHAWLGEDRFVLTRSSYGVEAKAKAWIVDLPIQKLTPLSDFDCPGINALAAIGNGDFVALATMHHKYTMETKVHLFDSDGNQKWTLNEDYSEKPGTLFSPEDVAITSTGEVAVIDKARNNVQLFDRSGNYKSSIALEKAWGRKPNYLSGITADSNGGFIVTDFRGAPPFVRMRADGSVDSGIQPTYQDGRNVDAQVLRVSKDKRLWTCDGHAILRLDESGVVDRILGNAPNVNRIGTVSSLVIKGDKIYARDRRTSAVSVFDMDGQFLHVCVPVPTDITKEHWRPSLAVNNEGHVFLEVDDTLRESKFVHFSDKGKRLEIVKFENDEWQFQTGSVNRLALGFHDAKLIDQKGKLLHAIGRRANGDWLEYPHSAACANDGSFVISADHSGRSAISVTIYEKDGTPVRTIEMPEEARYSNMAFDGKNLVVGSLDQLFYCNVDKGEFFKLTPSPATGSHIALHPHFENGELLIFDGSAAKLYRYKMPN